MEASSHCWLLRAELHLLAGRPGFGVFILDEMMRESVEKSVKEKDFAANYLQMLLLVSHSQPSKENLKRLVAFLGQGDLLQRSSSIPFHSISFLLNIHIHVYFLLNTYYIIHIHVYIYYIIHIRYSNSVHFSFHSVRFIAGGAMAWGEAPWPTLERLARRLLGGRVPLQELLVTAAARKSVMKAKEIEKRRRETEQRT